MDANGLRFWSFSEARDWPPADGLTYCPEERLLRLARRGVADPVAPGQRAVAPRDRVMAAADATGGLAWAPARAAVRDIRLALDGAGVAASRLGLAAYGSRKLVDLAVDGDGVLHLALAGRTGGDASVLIVDTRGRWSQAWEQPLPGLLRPRLAPLAGGGVALVDVERDQTLGFVRGRPDLDGLAAAADARFRTPSPSPEEPRFEPAPKARLPDGWTVIDVAASGGGRVLVLASWGPRFGAFVLRNGELVFWFSPAGLLKPRSIAWIGEDAVAILALVAPDGRAERLEARVFEELPDAGALTPASGPVAPSGRRFPLLDPHPAGFLKMPADPPLYAGGEGPEGDPRVARALLPLSGVAYPAAATTKPLRVDSGDPLTVWHRMYLEGATPEGAHVVVEAAASQDDVAPTSGWSRHLFGAPGSFKPCPDGQPAVSAAWLDRPSELPHHPGLWTGERRPGVSGLFGALVQAETGRARRLAGRFLWLRLTLAGDTVHTPAVAGLRVHASRFSYRDRYLPALYRDDVDRDPGAPAPAQGRAGGPDFLDRFLALIEEPLTLIEGDVALADLLTRAETTPPAALPWLAGWIGLDLPETATGARARAALAAAPATARLSGTLAGLKAALELATGGRPVAGAFAPDDGATPIRAGDVVPIRIGDLATDGLVLQAAMRGSGEGGVVLSGGMVSRGAAVVIEGFRLRRTFATILGADLDDRDDPLTLDDAPSGNSRVGDTLILGDADSLDALALFGEAALADEGDRAAVETFLASLAWRALVLVHGPVTPRELAFLRAAAQAAAPAHVAVTVETAETPFTVGLASLVGVDSFLGDEPARRIAAAGSARLGRGDLVGSEGLRGIALRSGARSAAAAPAIWLFD